MTQTDQTAETPDRDRAEEIDRSSDGFRQAHREFVRNTDRSFSTVYGLGGIAAMGLAIGVGYLGYRAWSLWSFSTWLLGVTGLLSGLFVLRIVIRLAAKRFYHNLETYCDQHGIRLERLRGEFSNEGLYPYFESIFEMRERHVDTHDRTSE